MARLSISQAIHTLGLSESTIRKRLRSGDLQGQKVKGAGGFRWEVFVADDPTVKGVTQDANVTDDANHANNGALVEILREELTEKNRQISELHRLLAQTALNAAPGRPWWKFWR
jgi:predicted DNA binding protein